MNIHDLRPTELKNMYERGILRVTGDIPMSKFDTPEYQEVKYLKNHPITVSEAERKYSIPSGTISRWIARGLIAKIGQDKNRLLIDEADIAYCAKVQSQSPGRGKWLFNPDGTPYIKSK